MDEEKKDSSSSDDDDDDNEMGAVPGKEQQNDDADDACNTMDVLANLNTAADTTGTGGRTTRRSSSSLLTAGEAAAAAALEPNAAAASVAAPADDTVGGDDSSVLVSATTAAGMLKKPPPPRKGPPTRKGQKGSKKGKKNVPEKSTKGSGSAAPPTKLPPRPRGRPKRRGSSLTAGGSDKGGRALSRRNSSNSNAAAQQRKQRKLPVVASDENPRRLVNPLTEWPSDSIQACELLPLMDIFHPLPDSYSIAYQARLLGFDLPPPPPCCPTPTSDNSGPVPLPANLSLVRDDGYQTIPALGTFADAIWKQSRLNEHAGVTSDVDDGRTLDVLDPLYEALLTPTQQPTSSDAPDDFAQHSKPVTNAHQTRLLQAGTAAWSDTLQQAQTLMSDNDDSKSAAAAQTTTAAAAAAAAVTMDTTTTKPDAAATTTTTTTTERVMTAGTSNSSSTSTTHHPWKVKTLADFQQQRSSSSNSNSDGATNTTSTTTTTTTDATSEQPQQPLLPSFLMNRATTTKPVPNECGVFLYNNNKDENNSSSSSVEEKKKLVAVATYHFAWYCHGNNQAGVVVNIHDVWSGSGVSCLTAAAPAAEKDQQQPPPPLSLAEMLLLMCLVLQHARAAQVWYVTLEAVPPCLQGFFATFFRMVPATTTSSSNPTTTSSTTTATTPTTSTTATVRMVCDLNKCSTRYAMLLYQQYRDNNQDLYSIVPPAAASNTASSTSTPTPMRALVRLPNVDDVKVALLPPDSAKPRSKRALSASARRVRSYFASAPPSMRNVAVGVRAQFKSSTSSDDDEPEPRDEDAGVDLFPLDPETRQVVGGASIDLPPFFSTEPSLEILRTFPLPRAARSPTTYESSKPDDGLDADLIQELRSKQGQVAALETGMEPSLRRLLNLVVEERMEYESAAAVHDRNEERRILQENVKMLEARKAKDVAEQEQLEQDMDAVCSICLDGEVTPTNQILFCETCDVPIHQYCYGIEQVPAGDYFCLACRPSNENDDTGAAARKPAPKDSKKPPPPSLVCELCPVKGPLIGGAFIESHCDNNNASLTSFPPPPRKWVHVVCAKWLGLNFVDNNNPYLVEDVTDLKRSFRDNNIKCELCQGERGCMNRCREENCTKWVHVTCARVSKVCQVTHGEDCHGDVANESHPWTLKCPEHSEISAEDVPKDAVPIEQLVKWAKELPPEPAPPPTKIIPFNKARGHERKRLLADPEYERKLLIELTTKRFNGVRCQVCDHLFDTGKELTKCCMCLIYFCPTCKLDVDDDAEGNNNNFKCPSCQYMIDATVSKDNGDDAAVVEQPSCVACYCKFGPLRRGTAKPVKMSHWNTKKSEFRRSLYGSGKLWVHSLCAFWNSQLFFSTKKPGHLDFTDVILSHGRKFIMPNTKCCVCGLDGGLKVKCDVRGCTCVGVEGDDKQTPTYFHVTCARQAGLEVSSEDEDEGARCYVHCYRHSGNENNLRAKLEDLIEIEKLRSGKNLQRADQPMRFSDASRLLNAAIIAVRTLGWAWRWAEWWVDYNSSWEPLLEPGEKEEFMTKEQLKIVDSTRESRCRDARKCRLAALGAALRNRVYDRPDGEFDRQALDRAFRAVLKTPSLVGPLKGKEIDFFVEWLGRAYRSRSVLLGLGGNKNEVANDGVCVHIKDKSPKYELGNRLIPGKQLLEGREIFEKNVEEVDDFMLLEVLKDLEPPVSISSDVPQSPSAAGSSASRSAPSKSVATVVKRPGRPRKKREIEGEAAAPARKRQRSDNYSTLPGKPGRKNAVPVPAQRTKIDASRIRPDGCINPRKPPRQNKDGTYARAKGPGPLGCVWDEIRGLWKPKAPRQPKNTTQTVAAKNAPEDRKPSETATRTRVVQSPQYLVQEKTVDVLPRKRRGPGKPPKHIKMEEAVDEPPVRRRGPPRSPPRREPPSPTNTATSRQSAPSLSSSTSVSDTGMKKRATPVVENVDPAKAGDARRMLRPGSSISPSRVRADGCLYPSKPPIQKEDGTYARSKGKPPRGFVWDKYQGMWAPQKNNGPVTGQRKRPPGRTSKRKLDEMEEQERSDSGDDSKTKSADDGAAQSETVDQSVNPDSSPGNGFGFASLPSTPLNESKSVPARKRRGLEITPVEVNNEAGKYTLVKRRRGTTDASKDDLKPRALPVASGAGPAADAHDADNEKSGAVQMSTTGTEAAVSVASATVSNGGDGQIPSDDAAVSTADALSQDDAQGKTSGAEDTNDKKVAAVGHNAQSCPRRSVRGEQVQYREVEEDEDEEDDGESD